MSIYHLEGLKAICSTIHTPISHLAKLWTYNECNISFDIGALLTFNLLCINHNLTY